MRNNQVYVHQVKNSKYPHKTDNFSPSFCYPEYKFPDEISKSENMVYDMIRVCLYNMGFDKERFGLKDWNPLKEIIKPGDVVLIKPNMVFHENHILENGTDCLITHPSLVRAMIDYVVLALDGKGTVIIGDAPMQSCDFEKLIEEQGYQNIVEFYRKKGIYVELVDFRNYKTVIKDGLLHKVEDSSNNTAITIDLGKKSEFMTIDKNRFNKLRITNYDHSIMYQHHNSEKNEYSIAKKILEADVIINMPKPKTHRKAGVTISLKNLVGISTNKEWLPHHTEGSLEEGGDEYLAKSFLKRKITIYIQKRNNSMLNGMEFKAKYYSVIARVFSALSRFFNKDRFSEGSWFGNDTIWRTILDLNKIIFYADKKGVMRDLAQRRMLIVADMIISGEGEGPLSPSPKPAGIIAMGINPVSFDHAISAIMGFPPSLIPSIRNALNIKEYPIAEPNETVIKSNNPNFNDKKPYEIPLEHSMRFKPSMGWQGYFNSKY